VDTAFCRTPTRSIVTRTELLQNKLASLQTTEADLWHDFGFTAEQLLSPRTSSKYHASRGIRPNVRAPIMALVALMVVGNAPPFVSPADRFQAARPPSWGMELLATIVDVCFVNAITLVISFAS
jgi:hypothetical protein